MKIKHRLASALHRLADTVDGKGRKPHSKKTRRPMDKEWRANISAGHRRSSLARQNRYISWSICEDYLDALKGAPFQGDVLAELLRAAGFVVDDDDEVVMVMEWAMEEWEERNRKPDAHPADEVALPPEAAEPAR